MKNMSNSKGWAFAIGLVYSVLALAAAAASLGYRFDVANGSYGFRVLLEGTSVLAIITFLSSLSLMFGVLEERSSFVAVWLVVHLVVPLYTAAFYAWAVYQSGYSDDFGSIKTPVPVIAIVAGIHVVVMILSTLVVHRHYRFLQLQRKLMGAMCRSELMSPRMSRREVPVSEQFEEVGW